MLVAVAAFEERPLAMDLTSKLILLVSLCLIEFSMRTTFEARGSDLHTSGSKCPTGCKL